MTTLAERNNNPLNLRPLPTGERWQGQTGVNHNTVTGAFCVFDTNSSGVRAATVNMRSYVKHAGVKTLRDVIYRWAPPPPGQKLTGTAGSAVGGVDQNHTEAYLASVCAETGLKPTFDMTPIALAAGPSVYWRGQLAGIIRAMNRVEAGKSTITIEETREGIDRALGVPAGYVRRDDDNVVREDMKQSETIKLNTGSQLANVAGTGVTAVTAVSTIQDWRVALIVVAGILVTGAAVGYGIYRLRKDRKMMSTVGIA